MDFVGKTAVITGAGAGIGKEVARLLVEAGANVVVSDRNPDNLHATAKEIGATAVLCDVTNEQEVIELVKKSEQTFGPIDLMCSNAGLGYGEPDHAASASNDVWQTCFDVHVMAQVYAARAVLPGMIERGNGYIVNMASAAGLLSQIGDAAYSATKHASVGFSESLAITHGDQGIKVSVICPQYVATNLTGYADGSDKALSEGTITPTVAAQAIVDGIRNERFLILTHPQVQEFVMNKAVDHGKWIEGMQRLRAKIVAAVGSTRLEDMHKLL